MKLFDFDYVSYRHTHFIDSLEILKKNRKIQKLMRPCLGTLPLVIFLVTLQFMMAFRVTQYGFLFTSLFSYFIGSILSQALATMIHESNHNLIFKGSFYNKIVGMLCDIPLCFSFSLIERNYHLLHHQYLGEEDWDWEVPSRKEAQLVKNSPIKKIIWILIRPFILLIYTPLRLKKIRFVNNMVIINIIVVICANILIIYLGGVSIWFYLIASTYWSKSLHPFGIKSLISHLNINHPQESYSNYGFLNFFLFNFGYHLEHHDFIQLPWIYLPQIKKISHMPSYSHRSHLVMFIKFIFDRKLTLFSRMIHRPPQTLNEEKGDEKSYLKKSGEMIFHMDLYRLGKSITS